jgi:hypothetical protein
LPNDDWRRPADHLTWYDLYPPFNKAGGEDPDSVLGVAGWPTLGLPAFYSMHSGELQIADPPGLDDLVVLSLKTMLPHVKKDLSIINSIIELKDFGSVKHTMGRLKSLFKSTLRDSKTASLRQLLQASADAYLQAKFNFVPLWSDIRGIHSALSKSMRRLGVHINSKGRPVVAHFQRPLQEYTQPELETYQADYVDQFLLNKSNFNDYFLCTAQFFRSVVYEPTIFRAHMQYNVNYSAFQLAHAQGLTLLDRLGVNADPSIVWNAIPWSFVVDWLFNVSEYLSRFTRANMEPQINVMQYCWSVKRERAIRCTATAESSSTYPLYPNSGSAVHTYPVVTETAYHRSVGLPSASSFLTSGLNLNEFSLAAAIAIARRRKPKPKKVKPVKTARPSSQH